VPSRQGPTLRAQWLGQQLRELREGAGRTQKDAAEYLQRNPGTMSRFESAEFPIRRGDVMALLDFYDVSDQRRRDALIRLSEDVWQKGWWDGLSDVVYDSRFVDFVWLESRAHEIQAFDNLVVPGLLQTKAYAKATISAAEPGATAAQIQQWVDLRMRRQAVVTGPEARQLNAIIDEATLRRMVGGAETMRDQLRHLRAAADLPNVELRILPFSVGAHASPTGAFRVFVMADPYPSVGYVETPAGAIYVEAPGVDRFIQLYDLLSKAALGTTESLAFIESVTEELL
jgi:hypothetical protein